MTHRASVQHCPYVAVTPKLIPAKLQVPRALCFNDTRNLSKQPPLTGARAVPGCSAGSDSACSRARAALGLPVGAGSWWLSSSRSIPPGAWDKGRKALGWVSPKLAVAGGFARGSGEAEFIYPLLGTCFLTSVAPL